MPAPMTRDEREAFLAGVHAGVLTVDEPGRGPLSVPVWYLYEPGGEIVVVTRPEARKTRLLVAGARVSFCVQSEELPPKYVTIQGRVVAASPADVARDVKPVVRKYLGAEVGDAYVDSTRPGGTNEVVVRIRPERWYSRDFAKTP
jgi:nitroimidazol reductase NimA-like FMN-containing flavoprotein (pyridoxamine 5'-phosphate oxidase superfamily)